MELLGVNPGRRIIVSFLIAVAVGTLLLWLPISASDGPVEFIDALFTATSAVCVTGLTVLDTGGDFSLVGQIIILVLIQFGGLGIMTLATALLLSIGARLSFHHRYGLSQSLSADAGANLARLLKAVVLATLLIELIGAAALFVQFRTQFPIGQAAFQSVFHSVSAFCNAGFSLFSNSLENYSSNYFVIAVVSILIILGGLGFVVIAEMYGRSRRQISRFSLHTKLCLAATGLLLVGGTVLFMLAEYENVLGTMGFGKSLANAFFQAVTCRTAGFNTVPQADLTGVAIMIAIILMFIGACPGSTGGGIKTTSISIILLLVYNRFLGRRSVSAFRRSISNDSIGRAVTVFLLAVMVIMVAFVLLMFAQDRDVVHRLSHSWFVDNFFEVVSAFGTVGLSLGVTPHLNGLSKLVLIVLMFTGRVGLLTLAFALSRPPKQGEIIYSEEDVMVG